MTGEMKRRGEFLERVYRKYARPEFLETDPLPVVRRWDSPEDREVVGLVTALCSYGRVVSIRRHVEEVIDFLGPSPARFARRSPGITDERFLSLRYRFHTGRDLASLLLAVGDILRREGSLEPVFLAGGGGTRENLASLVGRLRSVDVRRFHPGGGWESSPGLRFLVSSPEKRSACKRWNLFFRWMVRPDDGIDLGVWNEARPEELVVPLDTHLHRIGLRLGLAATRGTSWEAAERFTAELRVHDPEDPTRFDFPLCRLGILDRCPENGFHGRCGSCELLPICDRASKGTAQNIR